MDAAPAMTETPRAAAKPGFDAVARARRFSVAPMMDWTDRHCRLFHRALTANALLYSEMVTTGAVRFGPRERLIGFSPAEHPVAAQLGGSEPAELAEAARICEEFGYAEINLNVGCPSDRVQDGRFGACLMAEPGRVADSVAAMKAAVGVPVTVKCRIGIDDQDPEQALDTLADAVVAAGCDALIVHARKAWLKGLSPKENRDIPPLDYGRVFRLKSRLPFLHVSINGGVRSLAEALALLEPREGVALDGVMIGRAAYQDPGLLLGVDSQVFGEAAPFASAREAVESLFPAISDHLAQGGRLSNVTRHMLGLFGGQPGARAYRRLLSEEAPRAGASLDVLRRALDLVHDQGSVNPIEADAA